MVDDSSPAVTQAKSRVPSSIRIKMCETTCKSMNFSRGKRAAACFLVIDLLEEYTEDESGESLFEVRKNKGMDQKEKGPLSDL